MADATLLGFVDAARGAGVRISVAETLDALRAAETTGYADRAALRDGLVLTLAKTAHESGVLGEVFDLYFSRDRPANVGTAAAAASEEEIDAEALSRMLLQGDASGIAMAIERAAQAAGVRGIVAFTQTNMFAHRILERMGLRRLDREIRALRDEVTGGEGLAAKLEGLRKELRERVIEHVEKQLALHGRGHAEKLREQALLTMRLSSLDQRDIDKLTGIVRAMAKRLATRYAQMRRRARRGQLDMRRTMRRNMATDAVPFHTVWNRRRIEKPRVLVLVDVSGSVAPLARFLLLFLYTLAEVLDDIRSFAFSSHTVEVSDVLETLPIEEAIPKVMRLIGYGSSNYGRSLSGFGRACMGRIDRKTTVVVLGDARGNYTEPRIDVLRDVSARAKRVVWLNPEGRPAWGTGDSDMLRYLPFCHVAETVATVRQLERVVDDMLGATR